MLSKIKHYWTGGRSRSSDWVRKGEREREWILTRLKYSHRWWWWWCQIVWNFHIDWVKIRFQIYKHDVEKEREREEQNIIVVKYWPGKNSRNKVSQSIKIASFLSMSSCLLLVLFWMKNINKILKVQYKTKIKTKRGEKLF